MTSATWSFSFIDQISYSITTATNIWNYFLVLHALFAHVQIKSMQIAMFWVQFPNFVAKVNRFPFDK